MQSIHMQSNERTFNKHSSIVPQYELINSKLSEVLFQSEVLIVVLINISAALILNKSLLLESNTVTQALHWKVMRSGDECS